MDVKILWETKELAAYFTTFVDDSRVVTGSETEEDRIVGLIWKYLGLQDSPRKRRMAGQYRGLWRGNNFHIIYGYIYQLIGEGGWAKTRIIILKWLQRVSLG